MGIFVEGIHVYVVHGTDSIRSFTILKISAYGTEKIKKHVVIGGFAWIKVDLRD